MKLVNELHQRSCSFLSRYFWRFIGMMHRVSPVRITRDRLNDSPALARRTHPAPSSSPWTCWWWWQWWWWPGAAGGETEKLLGCWVFATCSNYQTVCCWVPPSPRPLGICLNSVGFLSGALACQPKQSFVPATVNITSLSLFLSARRSAYSWMRQ